MRCRCRPTRLRTRRDVRTCTADLWRCCLHPDTRVLWFFRALGRKVCSVPESLLLQHISKAEQLLWGLVLTFWQTVLYAVCEHFCSKAGIYICGIYGTETKFLTATLPSSGKLTYAIAQQRTTLHCSSLIQNNNNCLLHRKLIGPVPRWRKLAWHH